MSSIVRLATDADCAAMAAIYAPFVCDTPISFETEPPTAREMAERLAALLPAFPWLVCEEEGKLVGYAYASKHRAREAYRWSIDVSVYVDRQHHRRGIGRRLYRPLLELVQSQGFCTAYAGITLPNPGSVALHESIGFRPLCVYRRVGHKLGGWHDVGWWEIPLGAFVDQPPEPKTLVAVVPDLATWRG